MTTYMKIKARKWGNLYKTVNLKSKKKHTRKKYRVIILQSSHGGDLTWRDTKSIDSPKAWRLHGAIREQSGINLVVSV